MVFQLTPFLFLYGFIFFLALSLGGYAAVRYLRHDRRPSILAFLILMLGVSLAELSFFTFEAVVVQELKLIAQNVTNAIIYPILVYSLLAFALAYSENERYIKWVVAASTVTIVGLSAVLALSPEFFYESRGLVSRGPVTVLGYTFEEWLVHDRELKLPFYLFQLYFYAVTVIAAGVLFRYLLGNKNEIYTKQAILIGIGIFAPLLVNTLVFLGVVPPFLNFTDVALGITSVSLAIAIFRYRMFRVIPISRQQLFDLMDDPVVLVDDQGQIVDSNRQARRVFDVGAGWRGMEATEFFGPYVERIQPDRVTDAETREVTITENGRERYFDVNITTVQTPVGTAGGRLIALRDVTALQQAKRELRQSNEKLDEFASTVSHDLRNPLNAAQLRFDLIRDEVDEEHADTVQQNLDRMETMIDDLLALARAGKTVTETESVSLAATARDAWHNIDSGDSEFESSTPAGIRVEADRDRLLHVFENLFRNAVEHNDQPVTIHVGILPENGDPTDADGPIGFFVEDDGIGIPADERDDVFERGYSTGDDGTGFGLPIVHEIVDAHGWTIHVTDGSDGGARFEIAGVEPD